MSISLINAIFDNGPEKSADRMMLLAIAKFMSEKDPEGTAWPSLKTLAELCCVTERPARSTLRRLEASGWLTVETKRGSHGTNRYRINVERLQPAVDSPRLFATSEPAVSDTQPAVDSPTNRLFTAPNQVENNHKNKKEQEEPASDYFSSLDSIPTGSESTSEASAVVAGSDAKVAALADWLKEDADRDARRAAEAADRERRTAEQMHAMREAMEQRAAEREHLSDSAIARIAAGLTW